MANLVEQDRFDCWANLMRDWSRIRDSLGLSKADLRAAVDGLDTWINTNAATINAAIPQPARTALTTRQKAKLLAAVILKRYEKGA